MQYTFPMKFSFFKLCNRDSGPLYSVNKISKYFLYDKRNIHKKYPKYFREPLHAHQGSTCVSLWCL